MKKLVKLAVIGVALGLMLGLSGCNIGVIDDSGYNNGRLTVKTVFMPDGTTVDCVYQYDSGVDCDWATRG